MASSKPDLARAGTMQVTADEGKAYLDKNLTEWKKPYLMDGEEEAPAANSKPKMSKHTTMKGTAKEAKALLGGEKLADTRQETKVRGRKPNLKKNTTINKTMEEAKLVYGKDLDLSEGRSLRKRPAAPKPPVKRAGTMQTTAKAGKEFLKRGRPKKAKKEEEPIEEEEEDSD